MKRCPECRKDYLDDSLLYCLDDGTALVQGSVTDEPATAILSGDAISGESPTRTLKAEDTAAHRAGITSRLSAFFSRERLPWILAAIFAGLAAVLGYAYLGRSSSTGQAVRLSFEPPKGLQFNDTQPDWAVISPDGQKVAFTANTSDGKYLLYVSDLKTGQVTPLPGSDNALEPFWSPDSKSVAYGSRGKLKRSDISGGNAQVLTDAARLVAGAWNKDGDIIFCPDYGSAMFTVWAKGGEPRQITFQEENGDGQHSSGTFLPDGRRFLFNRNATNDELKGLWMGSLDSQEVKRIVPDNLTVRFAPPDWLIMIKNQVLVAQKINTNGLELLGDPVPLITQTDNAASAPARFSVSTNGVLVWQPQWTRSHQLRLFDREGKQTGAIGNPELVAAPETPRISPDGKQVAYRSASGGILVSDLTGNNPIKLGEGQLPIWSPDGKSIAHNASVPGKARGIFQQASNGVGEPELLLSGTVFPRQYSPDGRFLLYTKRGPKTRLDVWLLSLADKKTEVPLLVSAADESYAEISPNGRWLAYISDETGAYELYVQSLNPDGTLGSDRKRISTDGAGRLAWSRDGKELFFTSRDDHMMATSVKSDGPTFEYTPGKALFQTRMMFGYGNADFFDVAPEGKFLIGTLVGEPTSPAPTVILNWPELVKK